MQFGDAIAQCPGSPSRMGYQMSLPVLMHFRRSMPESLVVRDHGPALAARQILLSLEAEDTNIAHSTHLSVMHSRTEGERRILDQPQIVLFCNEGEAVHITRYTTKMKEQNCSRTGRDGMLGRGWIEAERFGTDINQDGQCTNREYGRDWSRKGVRGRDHLVSST